MDDTAIRQQLGEDAEALLSWRSPTPGQTLDRRVLPGPDWVDRAWGRSDRSPAWLRSLQSLFDAGRLNGTGYLSLLAAPREERDPVGLADLAIEGGCSGLIASERLLGIVARTHAHRIPCLVRTSPGAGAPDVVARRLRQLGAVGVCVPLSSDPSAHPEGVLALLAAAAAEGMVALVHTPTPAGPPRGGLANTAAALGAALAWQDLVTLPLGALASTSRPAAAQKAALEAAGAAIEALRTQHADGMLGHVGMLGGTPEVGKDPMRGALRAATLNKRAAGMGQVTGRVATTLPREEGVALLHAIQDVYRCGAITLAG